MHHTAHPTYSLYAKVLVKSKTTPKNTIFATSDLLYLNHHNSPIIENPVVDTQLMLEQLESFTYWKLIVLKAGVMFKDFGCAKTAKKWNLYGEVQFFFAGLGVSEIFEYLSCLQYN